ncbi:GntR family transcriptional regulator [Pseudonocardia sp. CA-142604]|uniref:GntR family transcriptional regulator n=1 Tax=Pseudonocardia sp. CA-142604 TaxID=3240024 RepID=UPI003D91D31F
MSDENRAGLRRDFFEALARPLRVQICTGELGPGCLLPSESELARLAGTRRYSIRKALSLLRQEGLIEPVPGRGWAVVGGDFGPSGEMALLPRYRQIAAELRSAINAGDLAAGSILPSEADLVARHGVSRATVRQSLTLLEAEGLISARAGAGRYVRVH